MTEREKALEEFIFRFFEIAKTKRRHEKNTVMHLRWVINMAFNSIFNDGYKFTEDEISDAFYNKGFSILEPIDKSILKGKTKNGLIEWSNGNHLNVKSQGVSDLISSLRKGFPLKSKPDTIVRINNKKLLLQQFKKEFAQ